MTASAGRTLRTLGLGALFAVTAAGLSVGAPRARVRAAARTTTPIQHLVVIFGENVSFDHYFGTYPTAANPAGEPAFNAAAGTPAVNGLSSDLLNHNPNAANPFRYDRTQPLTCDMDHGYTAEQQAFDGGKMDRFVEFTEGSAPGGNQVCPRDNGGQFKAVMGFFDGNTVTALWNYAQRFAMSDSFFGTHFGPSTPGALAISAADTGGVVCGPAGSVIGTVAACGAPGAGQPGQGVPPPQGEGSITYQSGWNLVGAPAGQWVMLGNPSATQTLTVRGADAVFRFDPAANGYISTDSLAPGQGAWVLSSAGGTVTIGP